MGKNVIFSAKFDGLNLAAKSKITLILPENIKDDILGQLVRMKKGGSDLIVQFGDPQATMDFEDDEEEGGYQRPGVRGTIDQHGVVNSVQGDLFKQENVSKAVESVMETDESGPVDPYANKVVVLTEFGNGGVDKIEYIFPIVNGQAGLPSKLVNGEFISISTFDEVLEEIGLVGIETDGVIFYKIDELIGFGGHLRDANQADLDESELESDLEVNSDYAGKEIVISKLEGDDYIEYVFQIVDGEAAHPKKYENGKCVLGMNVKEVSWEIGSAPIGGYPDGHIRYMIAELLGAFNGVLRDIGEASSVDQSDIEVDLNEEISFEEETPVKETIQDEALTKAEPAAADIESFILEKKPKFDDIEFDFPTLLAQKKSGKSWMDIAKEINEPSTKISSAFTKYKKKVKDLMTGGAA